MAAVSSSNFQFSQGASIVCDIFPGISTVKHIIQFVLSWISKCLPKKTVENSAFWRSFEEINSIPLGYKLMHVFLPIIANIVVVGGIFAGMCEMAKVARAHRNLDL